MQQGWVYVLVNSSMPGMAKVGRTTRSPIDRVAELSQATGVATPFVLAFDQHFADCGAAERAIHGDLERRGLRIAPNREFFRGPASDIIRVVIETAASCLPHGSSPDDLAAELLLAAGNDCLDGTGGRPRDFSEAARLLKLAVLRGSLIAYERLGRVYAGLYGDNSAVTARRRTLETLKEGISKGNYYCYVEMATVFARDRNVANFTKAWELFFSARGAGYTPEVEVEPDRFEAACCRYIASSVALGLQPGHREVLGNLVHGLVRLLLDELDRVRQDERGRRLVVAALRWVHQSLLPGRTADAAGKEPAQMRRQLSSQRTGFWPSGYAPSIDIGQLAVVSDR